MNRIVHLPGFSGAPLALLVAIGTTAAFTVLLLGVLRLGLPIWTLLLLLAGIVYAFTVLHRPIIGVYFVVAVFFVPIQLFGFSLMQSIGGGTAALLLLWFLYQRRRIELESFLIPLFLMGPLILVSLLYTQNPAATLDGLRRWAFNMMFVLLLLNFVTTFEAFKKILWAILIMASVNSVIGMIEFTSASGYGHRSDALMGGANGFGHLAALAFPLALYQYIYAKGWLRWLGLALCAVLAGGVVTSVSRGALISVLLVFLVVMITERRRLLPLLLVAGIAASSIPLLPEYFHRRVGNLGADAKYSLALGHETQLTDRGHLNAVGLRIWAANPIMGVGFGNFGEYYVQPEFRSGMLAKESIVAHNAFIQALAEMGIVGTGVLVWMLVNAALSLLHARRTIGRNDHRRTYFGAVEMMTLTVLISMGVSGNLIRSSLWMFLGLAMITVRIAKTEQAADTVAEAGSLTYSGFVRKAHMRS